MTGAGRTVLHGTPGVILAGGRATRLGGGDKCLRPLGGRLLVAHVIDRLGPQVAALALNANGDPRRFAGLGLPVLPDPVAGQPGPLAGVLAAMDWAAERGAAAVVTVAADTPFLPRDLLARLVRAAGPSGLALAASTEAGGQPCRHPVVGLWPVDLRGPLRAALAGGVRKVTRFADANGAATAPFPPERPDPFFNINTPEDLAMAERMLGG